MSKRGFWGKAYIVLVYRYVSPPPRNFGGEFSLESPVFVFRESAGRGDFWGVGMKGLRIADGGDW